MKRFLLPLGMLLLLALLLSACTGGVSTGITHHWDCGAPVSARFYYAGGDEVMELPADRLEELVRTLDAMEYKTHGFHSDYFWHGQYGIELVLDDGTYLDYDGTCLEQRSVSMLKATGSETQLHKSYVEVTNCDFWEVMDSFFEIVGESHASTNW